MTSVRQFSRSKKLDIVNKLLTNLQGRQAAGPPEPALDAFIAILILLRDGLAVQVTGRAQAEASRATVTVSQDEADDNVDLWFRHIYYFLHSEAQRRFDPSHGAVGAILAVAFPRGLATINEAPVKENLYCRGALAILEDPTHAQVLSAAGLPVAWVTSFATALDVSDAQVAGKQAARSQLSTTVALGKEHEDTFAVQMQLLRAYIASRATPSDTAKMAEGRALIAPLTEALATIDAEAKGRKTKKQQKAASASAPPPPPPPPPPPVVASPAEPAGPAKG